MPLFDLEPATPAANNIPLRPKCGACGLHRKCHTGKMEISGKGRRKILVVGDGPEADDDRRSTAFCGPAGQFLREALDAQCGIDLDLDCWKTNSLICFSGREPSEEEIDFCRPNLFKAVADLQPDAVLLLGYHAVRSLLGPLWKEDPGGIATWVGWQIPVRRWNCWVCPTWHPAEVLGAKKMPNYRALRAWWIRHLKGLTGLPPGPPYAGEPPEYDIRIIYDPAAAATVLRQWQAAGGTIAFDYETNRLQPYPQDAEIVSCAVCWRGKETIAFPWAGEVIPAMRDLLASDIPKVGANTAFEDEWTHEHLGVWVNNWVKDVMLDAHVLDNRHNITSVKFQAFVRLGLEDWSGGVKPYFESADASGRNRIRELDLRTLLEYNGIDAAAEFDVAIHQREEWRNAAQSHETL